MRSPGRSGALRPAFLGNATGMLQHAQAALRVARHVGPKRQNWRKTMPCASMLKIGFRVRYRTQMGTSSQDKETVAEGLREHVAGAARHRLRRPDLDKPFHAEWRCRTGRRSCGRLPSPPSAFRSELKDGDRGHPEQCLRPMVVAANRNRAAARLGERSVFDDRSLPPEILLPGAKQSQDVKCIAVFQARRSVPHSATRFSASERQRPWIWVRSVPSTR